MRPGATMLPSSPTNSTASSPASSKNKSRRFLLLASTLHYRANQTSRKFQIRATRQELLDQRPRSNPCVQASHKFTTRYESLRVLSNFPNPYKSTGKSGRSLGSSTANLSSQIPRVSMTRNNPASGTSTILRFPCLKGKAQLKKVTTSRDLQDFAELGGLH